MTKTLLKMLIYEKRLTIDRYALYYRYNSIRCLQGRVRFPTGGKVREPYG